MANVLPCDLKERILKHLALPDRIRLSAVNTSWHSAVTSANERYPPPPQLPWLMLLHPVSTRDNSYKFLNLSENKAYTLQLPHIIFRQYFGTGSHGWILAIDKNKTSSARLLNPLTGAKISLPSFATLPGYKFKPKWMFKVLKVEIGWGSGGIAERILLLFEYFSMRGLAFWRPGEERWNWLNTTRWEDRVIDDILAYKGEFCIVSQAGEVLICRPGEDPPLVPMVDDFLPPPHSYRWYLVASLNGELLLVGRVKDSWNVPRYDFRTKRFDIFKLNSCSGSSSSWEKVETLGMESLFMDNNASICLSVTDYPGWKENCIYFIGDRIGRDWITKYNYNDLYIFSLEDGSIKPLRLSIYHPTLVSPIWLPPQTLVLRPS